MRNYFAPAFRVEVNGSQLAADISKNIQQVSIVTKPDTLDTFSLTIANQYPEMRWTHNPRDSQLFQEGNSVTIALGYVDDMQEMFDGEITQISPSFPESGMPTIAIEGHTRLHWLQSDKKTRTFQSMTDKQIAEKIAQEAGLTAKAEDTQTQHDYVMQPNLTDLQFLKSRAALIHFEVLVDKKTLVFRKAKEAENKIYTLVWGHAQAGLAPAPNTLPLKSFNPVMNTSRQVNKVTVRGYDPKSKQHIVAEAGPGAEDTKMGGSATGGQVSASAFHKPREFVRVSTPIASQAEADQHAKAIYNDSAMNFVTGNGSTIGVPDLRSGSVVELQGLGSRFSGQYYIEEATHTIDSDGYQLTFSAKRNSV